MRSWRYSLVAAAACGRVSFEPLPDAATISGTANVAFVTSSTHDGALGGLAGADAICMQRAGDAGLPGTFVAWMSTPSTSAFSRIAGARGWRLVDGTPLADEASDFATKQVLAPFALDEHGNDVRSAAATPWTGTDSDGINTVGVDCSAWTTNSSSVVGDAGDAANGAQFFTAAGNMTCDQLHPLFCLQVDRVARVAFAHPHARLAFVSDAAWLPNAGGVASADAQCTAEATAAGLAGMYRAALPTGSQATQDRFDLTGLPWARVDGALLAPTATELFGTMPLANFPDRTATDRLVVTSVRGGDPTQTAGPCTGWTSADSANSSTLGLTWASNREIFTSPNTASCDDPTPRLLCLQQ